MSEVPATLRTKQHLGAYSSLYAKIYLEEKAKREKKPIGAIIDMLVADQRDFKEQINNHLEHLKL